MNEQELSHLTKAQLLKILKVYSLNWITLDGLWFSGVEEKFGMDAAVELDERMWSKQSAVEAHRMREALNITTKGPAGVAEAYGLLTACTGETFAAEYSGTPQKMRVRVPHCTAQEARQKRGKPIFPCKPVGLAIFKGLIKEVDPSVKLKCLLCPPDPVDGSYWCEWELSA